MNIFQKPDFLLLIKLFAGSRKPKKGKTKSVRFLWQTIGPRKRVFSTENTQPVNPIDYAIRINPYIKVKGDNRLFDGNTKYGSHRLNKNLYVTKRKATLIKN